MNHRILNLIFDIVSFGFTAYLRYRQREKIPDYVDSTITK